MFLIVDDAHAKWTEVQPVKQANSITIIQKLRSAFTTHGLPEMVVSDSASDFTSTELKS